VAIAPIDVGRAVRDGTLVALDRRAAIAAGGEAGRATAFLPAGEFLPAAVDIPGSPARLAVTVDAEFVADPAVGGGTIRSDAGGLTVTAVLRDADGRLFRTAAAAGAIDRVDQRLVVPIGSGATRDLRPSGPLAIVAIELGIQAVDPISISGSATLVRVAVSDALAGEADWRPIAVSSSLPGWAWATVQSGTTVGFTPSPDAPNRISVGRAHPIVGGLGDPGSTFRLFTGPAADTPLPAIASRAFLAQTGGAVGDLMTVSSRGLPIPIRIAGSTDGLAPLDPAEPLLVADLGAFDAMRFLATGLTAQAAEWLITVAPGREAAVIAALREPGAGTSRVIGRAETTGLLLTDPVPLGLIGILGLGSVAALLFAGIGFLVSSTVSTSERIGEFALLRALGLSTGQLALWLSIESIFLLVVGLGAGSALGFVLAWLVLPFATLTQTGLAPLPSPVVLVPWDAIVPAYLGAVGLFVLSLWIVRRQLPDIEISGVLRARSS
jgi:hypothetical protein